jgi:trehalose 6-phosphate synthase/phosphatase
MEYINGIPYKLRAFQSFLQKYPEWREKVVLFLHCRPNADALMNEKNYKDLCEEVEKLVGSINGQFGSIQYMPVVYLNQQLSWEETVAMFAVADAALITPLRYVDWSILTTILYWRFNRSLHSQRTLIINSVLWL